MKGFYLGGSNNANVLVNLRDFPLIGIVWHGNILTPVSSISKVWQKSLCDTNFPSVLLFSETNSLKTYLSTQQKTQKQTIWNHYTLEIETVPPQ